MACDAPRAEREEHREHHRELLGDIGHCKGDAGQQGFQPVAMCPHMEEDDRDAGRDPERGEQQHHAVHLALQRAALGHHAAQGGADPSDGRGRAGGDHQRRAPSADDERARVHLRQLAAATRRTTTHRNRFSREQRFVDDQRVPFDQLAVRRDAITFLQQHGVAHDDLARGDDPHLAVAHDPCARAAQVTQCLQCALGTQLLEDGEGSDQPDRGHQDPGFGGVSQQQVHDRRRDQHQDHRFAHDRDQDLRPAPPVGLREAIGAIALQPCRRLVLAKSLRGILHPGILLRRRPTGLTRVKAARGRREYR